MIKTFISVLFFAVVAIVGVLGYRVYHFVTSTSPATEVAVSIPSGSSLRDISETLAASRVVNDPYLFEMWTRIKGLQSRIRAGRYIIPPYQHPDQVLQALIKGGLPELSFVVPEGWTMTQIEQILMEKLGPQKVGEMSALMRNPEWLKQHGIESTTAEGYLFPATYAYDETMSGEKILTTMIETFHRKIDPLWKDAVKPPLPTLKEVLALASIVEREAKRDEERPIIAAVYLNRLRVGMPLQADPTVIYGIQNFDGNLTKKDLQADQPYNTYVRAGLTPTPICNPGLAAIKAVLAPADVEFLYFVGKADGSHVFSKTLDEHNQAVQQYQILPAKTAKAAAGAPAPVTTEVDLESAD